MCYDIKTKLETQLKRAKKSHDLEWIKQLEKALEPYQDHPLFHASAFAHPKILIYTNEQPFNPIWSTWGLVPPWVKDKAQLLKTWNNTINARGETIFEKPSFRQSAKNKRCLIVLDGFYEHHHFRGETYPFFISRKDEQPLTIAGLWSEWVDKETGELLNTFSIVTTKGNELMAKIHNNPKLKEARMPVILTEETADLWLKPIVSDADQKEIIELIKAFPSDQLEAYSVRKLRGKNAVGNVPEASERYDYAELGLSSLYD